MSRPTSFLLDTDCLIALLSLTHPFHEDARAEMSRRLAAREALVVASETIIQAYSVLTRLPSRDRLPAMSAWTLIEAFRGPAPLVRLSSEKTDTALREAASLGIVGGAIHDYLIAVAAVQAGVATLLTFNLRDFTRFGLPIAIVRPSSGG